MMTKKIVEGVPSISPELTENRDAEGENAVIISPQPTRNCNCVTTLLCGIGEAWDQILYKMNIKKARNAERNDDDHNSRGGLLRWISRIVDAEERSMGSSETDWMPPPDPMDNSARSSIFTNIRGLPEKMYRDSFRPSPSPGDAN